MDATNWQLKKYVIGLRHERIFYMSDIHGAIMDAILQLRKTVPFSKRFFSHMTRPDVSKIILSDKDEYLSLTSSIDGTVIQADVSEDSPVNVKEVEEIFIHVINAVLPMTEAKNRINRLGAINEFHISGFKNSANSIFSQLMKVDLQGIHDNMLMRISLKNPSMEAIQKPDKTSDYKNVILNISSEREKDDFEDEESEEEPKEKIPTILKVSSDYQAYYIPPRTLKHIDISKHLAEARSYNERNIQNIPLRID